MLRSAHAPGPAGLAIFAWAAVAACGSTAGSPLAPGDGHPEPVAPTSATSAPLRPPDTAPADLLLPGPGPRPPLEPVADLGLPSDEGCARCHAEIAAEQAGSLHHNAWQNAYFVRAYALEKTAFCRKCHAPGADPAAEPPAAAREAGVGCTTCHVVPAGVVGTRAMAAQEKGHAVLGDARLATPEACGACHDFVFPGPPGVATGPMQDTLAEHRRSAEAEKPCQTCHMPLVPSRDGGAHRSHAFRVQGDTAMLAKAVVVNEAVLAKGEVRLSLSPGAIGHAFPTGDLFRRAEVRVTPMDAAGHPLPGAARTDAAGHPLPGAARTDAAGHPLPGAAAPREVLERTFAPAPIGKNGMAVSVQRSDTRLAGPRAVVIPVPAGTRRARWQIVWQRLPPWLAEQLRMTMSDHETIVLEGTVSR